MPLNVSQEIIWKPVEAVTAKKCDGYGVSTQVIDGRSVWRSTGPSNQLFFEPALAILSHITIVAMVKRKHDSTGADSNGSIKKTAKSQSEVHANFGDKLFDNDVVTKYREDYAKSGPYVASRINCFSESLS